MNQVKCSTITKAFFRSIHELGPSNTVHDFPFDFRCLNDLSWVSNGASSVSVLNTGYLCSFSSGSLGLDPATISCRAIDCVADDIDEGKNKHNTSRGIASKNEATDCGDTAWEEPEVPAGEYPPEHALSDCVFGGDCLSFLPVHLTSWIKCKRKPNTHVSVLTCRHCLGGVLSNRTSARDESSLGSVEVLTQTAHHRNIGS